MWMIYRRDRYLRGGDHIPFVERGFAGVRFTESDEDYAHQHQNVRTVDGTNLAIRPNTSISTTSQMSHALILLPSQVSPSLRRNRKMSAS